MAALETFYYAFNHRDADALRAVWLDDELVQRSPSSDLRINDLVRSS